MNNISHRKIAKLMHSKGGCGLFSHRAVVAGDKEAIAVQVGAVAVRQLPRTTAQLARHCRHQRPLFSRRAYMAPPAYNS